VAVSLALRGSAEVSEATRERVLKAARALRYVPDESARRLKGGRPGRLAYVASRLAHGFVGQVLVGLEQRAFETKKYFNAIQPYSTWFQTKARDSVLEQILYGGLADAVILVSCKPSAAQSTEFKRHGVPLILVEDKAPGCHSVRVDNVRGAKLAVERLLAQGCRRLGLIGGRVGGSGLDLNPTTLERRQGFAAALKAAGLKPDPKADESVDYYESPDGRGALARLLSVQPKVDGIFCAAGDKVALGVLEEARARGLQVPRDLKLIGFDDIEAASLVGLSTVRQPIAGLGMRAFDLAVAAVEGSLKKDTDVVFEPELVLRGTA
jgi:LacI family transcriptional regulator